MAVSLDRAPDFVYGSGVMWERALIAYLFDGGLLAHVHQCLLRYKNPDNGWGHDLEHDIKCPESHPLALEFLLSFNRDAGLPVSDLLAGTGGWLEANRQADGSLNNPPAVLAYPHAPWWNGGGQSEPDSIVGNLARLGLGTPSLAESTRAWVQQNRTVAHILANEWLFMAYHAYDYFIYVNDFPDLDAHRQATIDNIVACATALPEEQIYSLFVFAPTPESPLAQALPEGFVGRCLDYLACLDGALHISPHIGAFVIDEVIECASHNGFIAARGIDVLVAVSREYLDCADALFVSIQSCRERRKIRIQIVWCWMCLGKYRQPLKLGKTSVDRRCQSISIWNKPSL